MIYNKVRHGTMQVPILINNQIKSQKQSVVFFCCEAMNSSGIYCSYYTIVEISE